VADFDTTEMEADLDEIASGLVQSATFLARKRGKSPLTVAAIIGDVSNSRDGTEEGLFGDDSISVTVKASLLTWTPRDGDTVQISGTEYRIKAARRVPGDAAMSFDLEAITK
jgi:hypothetical protein